VKAAAERAAADDHRSVASLASLALIRLADRARLPRAAGFAVTDLRTALDVAFMLTEKSIRDSGQDAAETQRQIQTFAELKTKLASCPPSEE
jgi:hypothetical protein